MKNYSKNLRPLKGLYQFVTRNNAVVIALELAIFAGVIFALAAEPETEIGGNTLQQISTNFNEFPSTTTEPISAPVQEGSQTTEQAIVENNELGIMNQEIPEGGQELLEKRTENSKTRVLGYTDDGRTRYSLDSSIGAIHYKDNYADPSEPWKDIDLTWEGNKITKAPYILEKAGNKIIVTDKKTGEISTIELLDAKPAGMSWEIVPENTRVSFRHTLPNDKVPFEAKFRVTGNIPLKTRAFDDEGELSLETTLVDGILTEKMNGAVDKETGKARPVKGSIKIDPTLDLQVGASADDGVSYSTLFSNSSVYTIAGRSEVGWTSNSFHRFTNVTMSGTIDVAYISWKRYGYSATPSIKVSADDQANPSAPTTKADHDGRTRTTENVTWAPTDPGVDNWANSSSIVTVIQELVDSYTYDGNDSVQILLDNLASSGGTRWIQSYSWDQSGNLSGVKLHIEYTAAGGGAEYQPRPGGVSPSGGGFMMF